MRKAIPVLLVAAVAGLPAGAAVAATPKKTVATHTYAGPSVDMQWGPVQVTIAVRTTTTTLGRRKTVVRKLVDVSATAPVERPRSQFINEQAVPILRQETLQAQSASIDLLSGATMTSEAYASSLQAALHAAGFKA